MGQSFCVAIHSELLVLISYIGFVLFIYVALVEFEIEEKKKDQVVRKPAGRNVGPGMAFICSFISPMNDKKLCPHLHLKFPLRFM